MTHCCHLGKICLAVQWCSWKLFNEAAMSKSSNTWVSALQNLLWELTQKCLLPQSSFNLHAAANFMTFCFLSLLKVLPQHWRCISRKWNFGEHITANYSIAHPHTCSAKFFFFIGALGYTSSLFFYNHFRIACQILNQTIWLFYMNKNVVTKTKVMWQLLKVIYNCAGVFTRSSSVWPFNNCTCFLCVGSEVKELSMGTYNIVAA